jgi:hypothetical protein
LAGAGFAAGATLPLAGAGAGAAGFSALADFSDDFESGFLAT